MRHATIRPLRRLAAIRLEYGTDRAHARLEWLRAAAVTRFRTARQVASFHELLTFLLAYPDDARVFAEARRQLRSFQRRPDLRRFRAELIDSAIAGTDIFYRFPAPTARWLAGRCPSALHLDWDEIDADRLARHLPSVVLPMEVPGYDEGPLPPRSWLARLVGPRETDATFLIRRFAAHRADPVLVDRLYDEVGPMIRIAPGPSSPTRTAVRFDRVPLSLQPGPLRLARPDLRVEAARPPRRIRDLARADARVLIDLAIEAMVTRSRDLGEFTQADPHDARWIDDENGLAFAGFGVAPVRRFPIEAVYTFLILRNGVPVGYALTSALFESCEVAFNIFETFRGAEAAWIYGRLLATLRVLFGADTFSVPPYQLGDGNDEGIESGAWWFYYKLGFRPRDPAIRRIVGHELAQMRRNPRHRSDEPTLRQLVRRHVFLGLAGARPDVVGALPLERVALRVTDWIARDYGDDRERAARECADRAAALLNAGDWRRLAPAERTAWTWWAPVALLLPGVARWTATERRALGAVMRAKGGRRESDFVRRFDAHSALRKAIVGLVGARD